MKAPAKASAVPDGASECQGQVWPRFRASDRVLVMGTGGGLDILAAFGVAQVLQEELVPPGMIMFGGAELHADLTGFVKAQGCLFKRPKYFTCTPNQRKRVEMHLPSGLHLHAHPHLSLTLPAHHILAIGWTPTRAKLVPHASTAIPAQAPTDLRWY